MPVHIPEDTGASGWKSVVKMYESRLAESTAENKRLTAALKQIADDPNRDGQSRNIAGAALIGYRSVEQATPQSFIEAKRERDDGWPEGQS